MVSLEEEHEPQNLTQASYNKVHQNEENEDEEEQEQENVENPINLKKRKRRALTSPHWKGFTRCTILEGDPPEKKQKGRCHTCNTLIAVDPRKNGTTGLKNHSLTCQKNKDEVVGQTILGFQPSVTNGALGSLTACKFDQMEIKLALCEMIVLDELPFIFVEREGFKKFVARACPMFKIPCRKSVRADCVKHFLERKESLRSFFMKEGMGRVSLTTDCWTAINSTNFICVTAHVISKDWVLHKKIISFCKIVSHKGEDIGDSIIISMEDWGMKSILCCTVDNASANDVAVRYVRDRLEMWGTGILGGKLLHLRCVAHILNLVVLDGLEEIGLFVRRVREAVKYIKASPSRIEQFNTCVQLLKIGCKKALSLDVPTRWNSTYLMLESTEPYEVAIKLYEGMNSMFVADLKNKKYKDKPIGVPEASDWINVRKMMEYLKKFYDMTCLVSRTKYVTVHLFFKEMCDIFDLITQLEQQRDHEISAMATKMKMKVGKYWLETDELNPKLNKVLYIAAILDPRHKMKHVEKCLKKVYGANRAIELSKDVRDSINEIFDVYKKNLTPILPPRVNASQISNASRNQQFDTQRRSFMRGSCSIIHDSSEDEDDDFDSSELHLYLAEKQFKEPKRAGNETDVVDSFDILNWWSTHSPRFPILSAIAKDIFVVPISTVASESTFSTGGRVLDAFRSSLSPKMVEALICSEDWLRTSSFMNDEEDLPEEMQEEEYLKVLGAIGIPHSNMNLEGTNSSIVSVAATKI